MERRPVDHSGRLRLARRDHGEILEACRETLLGEDCPESELDPMLRLAEDELNRAAAALADEAAGWPDETDCDRLDRVEEILRDRGILLWQVSPCCDTCTCGELSSRLEAIDQRAPGFSERARGYTFFIDQNLPGNLADGSQISVYLAYGHLLPSDAIKTPKEGVQYSLDIAREVCDCLRNAGFDADWNGSYARKIRLPLNWQRRTRLQ